MPVDDAAAARPPSPAKAAGVAAIVMGATTHGRSEAFFHQILIDASEALSVTKLCLWTTPTASKAALAPATTATDTATTAATTAPLGRGVAAPIPHPPRARRTTAKPRRTRTAPSHHS